jgi:hypothetical protein
MTLYATKWNRCSRLTKRLTPGKLSVPGEPFAAGLGDHKIITTLYPGGKERMRRLMGMVLHGRLDLTPLLTHRFKLDQITVHTGSLPSIATACSKWLSNPQEALSCKQESARR